MTVQAYSLVPGTERTLLPPAWVEECGAFGVGLVGAASLLQCLRERPGNVLGSFGKRLERLLAERH